MAAKIALVPSHDPTEPRLQRRDARAELVTVQRKPRFESQGVARTEAGRREARRDQRVPHVGCERGRHVDLDPVLARVTRSGDRPLAYPGDVEPRDRGGVAAHRRQQLARLGTLHREHGTRRRDVGDLELARGVRRGLDRGGREPFRVRRVRHHEEPLGLDPPDDDVVDDVRVVGVEQMRVLRPARPDPPEIVGEQPLQRVERAGSGELDGAEVRHVEHDRVFPARAVLLEHTRVLQRHRPAAERHHARTERFVLRVERATTQRRGRFAHALSAVASGDGGRTTREKSSGAVSPTAFASTSCDGGSSPYFTSR